MEELQNQTKEINTLQEAEAEVIRRNINPDIYGWIKIPGTKINYPIAQTDDNTYYLDHAYTGDNLVNGSIFADYRADASPMMNYNTVLYGHNIKDGSMFNNVSKFFEEETFNNTLIYLYTFSGIYVYKPFSVHETEYDSGFIAMGMSSEKFVEFATQMRNESTVPSSKEFTYRDRMITLSTCTNGVNTRRFALHGYLVQKITD
jgi:sortase B